MVPITGAVARFVWDRDPTGRCSVPDLMLRGEFATKPVEWRT
jgi:hypothetical protein